MKRLTEIAMEKANRGLFTRPEVNCWMGGSPDRQFSLLKRAIASREIVRLHRGLYCLAARYLRAKPDPLVVAQRIYGPSYISSEMALSYHGWIPEATYTITSVSLGRGQEFDTPLGRFSYTPVPQKVFYAEVERVQKEDGAGFLLARPLKALADYVYVHKCEWDSARPVIESLRVDEAALADIGRDPLDRLGANYTSRRVRRFLEGLRKDLTS